jgi:Ser/Thr protein kinase RdoA (MazF antagonist)
VAEPSSSTVPDEERLRGHLEARHGLRIRDVRRLQRWSPFVHRVEHHDGSAWVARLFQAERPAERVTGDAEILRFLASHDFPAERCATDDPISVLDGHAVLVTEYVDGVQFDDYPQGGPPERTGSMLRTLGSLLGRLHALPISTGAVMRDAGSWHYDLDEGLPRQDIAAGVAMLDAIAGRVPDEHRARFESLREQLHAADDCHDLPRTLVHPDFGGSNVIVRSGDQPIVVDWTGAGRGPRIVSLAWLLSTCPDARQIDAIVAGYRTHVALTDAELSRLGAAMRIRLLFFACRSFWRTMLAGQPPFSAPTMQATLSLTLRATCRSSVSPRYIFSAFFSSMREAR